MQDAAKTEGWETTVRFLILTLPALGFVVTAYNLHSVTLGLLSVPAIAVTIALAAAAGAAARTSADARRADPWYPLLGIGALGAVMTAYYWLRVWAYQDWDLLGVPVLLAQIGGFWWPAVLYAMAVWLLEGRFGLAAGRRGYWRRLAAGVVGGIVGLLLYPRAGTWYFARFDRQPLWSEMRSLQVFVPRALYPLPAQEVALPPVPGQPPQRIQVVSPLVEFRNEPARLHWYRRGRHLFLEADLGEWKQVTARRSMRTEPFRQQVGSFLRRAEEVLQRKDVRALTVRLRVGEGEVLEFHRRE